MYLLSLVLNSKIGVIYAVSNVLSEAGYAYIFDGTGDDSPHFIGQIDNFDGNRTFRVMEGNPVAFENETKALESPITLPVKISEMLC
ncbi:MAG: hypothetical protein U9O20_02435 [Patescibacteria group bacterium]|nr:hypothetical protein [Patescibacteria group bacterium]